MNNIQRGRFWAKWVMLFWVALIASSAAAAMMSCESKPNIEELGITHACKRSFTPTLEAYEDATGTAVKAECRKLDREYDIELVQVEHDLMELCGVMPAVNEDLRGCAKSGVIFISASLTEDQRKDTAVHEWLHVLLFCMTGDWDIFHLNGQVWVEYGDDAAEPWALSSAEPGTCL